MAKMITITKWGNADLQYDTKLGKAEKTYFDDIADRSRVVNVAFAHTLKHASLSITGASEIEVIKILDMFLQKCDF